MTAIQSTQTSPAATLIARPLAMLLLAAALPWMTQCGHLGGYKSVVYSKEKLATPPTTLSEREYPFDEKGNYRTDWVKGGSTKPRSASSFRTASTSPRLAPPTVSPQTPPASSATSRQEKTKKPPTRMTVASNATQAPTPSPPPVYTPAPTPPPPKPKPPVETKPQARYHTIAKGDTLWGISRKYKIPVDAIKSANGLSSDLIRPGQTLRIP